MNILALETSSCACSVALLSGTKAKVRHELVPMRHASTILSFIEETLGSELNSLDALAWGCGPGSFTGLRIAASVIQALSFAYDLPVINVSSLAALAQTAYLERGWKRMLVAVDAQMNEIYWGSYRINESGYAELVDQEALLSPAKLLFNGSNIEQLKGEEDLNQDNIEAWYGVGNGWSIYKPELENCLKNTPKQLDVNCLPKALAVAHLGRLKYKKGEALHSFHALPSYLRDQDSLLK